MAETKVAAMAVSRVEAKESEMAAQLVVQTAGIMAVLLAARMVAQMAGPTAVLMGEMMAVRLGLTRAVRTVASTVG